MKKFVALFTTFIIIGSVYAQNDESRTVTIQVACPSFSRDYRVLSVLAESGKWEQIPLSVRYPSSPQKVQLLGNNLNFYSPDAMPTPETPATPLASVTIPASATKILLLLLPSGKERPAYQALAIPMEGFKFGGICMLNTLPELVAMTIDGKSKEIIQSLKPLMLNPPIIGEKRTIAIRFFLPTKPQRPFYSANWNLRSDIRELHIIYLDPITKRPKIKTIVDMKPTPTKISTGDPSSQ